MPAAIAFILVAVVVVVLLAVPLVKWSVQRSERERALAQDDRVEHLEYVVPTGHDPAAVVAALEHEGFRASAEPSPEGHRVLIACEAGADGARARVRATIQHSQASELEVPDVRFADETGGTR